MRNTIRPDVSWQPLGEIACLLQLVADRLWETADIAGVGSPLHSLGLGSFLAAGEATRMLPADVEVPSHSAAEATDPVRMLEAVEQLTRRLDPRLAGAGDLVVAVTDLLREARNSAL